MAGIKQLRQIQLGKETTAGTATTATTRWRGLGALEDGRIVTFPEEFIGVIGGGDRSYIAKVEAGMSMDEVDATFEQLPHLLIASIAATTAGVQDTSGSGYVYTYTIPHSSAPTIQTYTIRAGDDQQAEIMAYSFVQSMTLSGNAGEAVMMGAEWVGRAVENGSFSTGVSVPSVETILASSGAMYLDAVSSTYGNTAVTSTLISFSLDMSNMIAAKWTVGAAGGTVGAFDFHYAGNREITGSLQFEHNSTATTEKTAFRDQTPRLLRLKFSGSTLTTAGSGYSVKTLIIDLPIKYESFDTLDDIDGNSVVTANFVSKYNETVANAGKFIVVLNGTTSIP
jgi:hypothetical protein